jgi:hypothetical protein
MSWFSKAIGLDKNKELERTINALLAALVPHLLSGKAAQVQAWADKYGIDGDALDELVDILDGGDAPAITVASVGAANTDAPDALPVA